MASPTPINAKELEISNSSSSPPRPPPPPLRSSITTNNTMYVHAEPWAFREVVQKLTGVPEDSPHKLPVSGPPRSSRAHAPAPPPPASLLKRQKLQERRRAPAKLEIELGPSSVRYGRPYHNLWSGKAEAAGFSSPVSTADPFFFSISSPSPTTPSPSSLEEEGRPEKRAIAEKGFYLHPSPRSGGEPPKLLPLFPLHSPRDSSPP